MHLKKIFTLTIYSGLTQNEEKRIYHVELIITSNKKSLCKQCLFLEGNLKSDSPFYLPLAWDQALHWAKKKNKTKKSAFWKKNQRGPDSVFFFIYVMCFVTPEQKFFHGQFCHLTLSSVFWNQGLNFAKFLSHPYFVHSVLRLQSRSCFTAILLPDSRLW